MGEPAELSAFDVTRVRQWAQALVDAVVNDLYIARRELLGCDYEQKDRLIMAQLERAQVIVDSVSRAALIEKLERERFQEDPAHGEHENAVRHGWNLGRESLLRELKDGRL